MNSWGLLVILFNEVWLWKQFGLFLHKIACYLYKVVIFIVQIFWIARIADLLILQVHQLLVEY